MIIRDRLIAALEARGYKVVEIRTKSTKMKHPDHFSFLLLGPSGSLRSGPNRSSSVPVDAFKAQLLREVDCLGG